MRNALILLVLVVAGCVGPPANDIEACSLACARGGGRMAQATNDGCICQSCVEADASSPPSAGPR